jgi:C-terminal processing protease CtpA/Prc
MSRCASVTVAFVLLSCGLVRLGARQPTDAPTPGLAPDAVRATVTEIATLISHEYMDQAIAERLSASLQKRLADGSYVGAATPEALATQLTRDLFADSQDKHLAVTLARRPPAPSPAAPAANGRDAGVRATNGGVQRVEVLSGNVGYLNLTTFWRVEEVGDIVAEAMRLLRRADALILDMRQNSGGSPGTVALLFGYLFDRAALPLFDIVPRTGTAASYVTPTPAPPERDERRPMYVLTSARTFSAGEGVAFLLQERKRAEVIGERTAGAANPGRPYPVSALFEVTIPNGRVRSAVGGGNWEGRGVTPDVEVPEADALRVAHTRALARLARQGP